MHPIVEAIQSKLFINLKDIEFKSQWLLMNQNEINKESERDFEEKLKLWAQKYRFNKSKHQKNEDLPELIVIQGIEVRNYDYITTSPTLSASIGNITQKYREQFNQIWDKEIAPKLTKQIALYNPDDIIQQVFQRHSWLQKDFEEFSADSTIKISCAYQFLNDLITTNINKTYNNNATTWTWASIKAISTVTPNTLNPTEIADKIESFPYANVHDDFYEHFRSNYLLSISNRMNKLYSNNIEKISLQRIDLVRFLTQLYPEDTVATLVDNRHTLAIMPLHVSELEKCTRNQLIHFKSLFVNLNTEEDTHWIMLQKPEPSNPDNWIAYTIHSDNHEAKIIQPLNAYLKGKTISVCGVDCADNASQNDLESSEQVNNISVLLGRVLPWTKLPTANKPALNEFRNTVPMSVLIEYSFLNSCPYKIDDNQHNEFRDRKLNFAFSRRYPFSKFNFQALCEGNRETVFDTSSGFLDAANKSNQILAKYDSKEITVQKAKAHDDFDTLTVKGRVSFSDLSLAYYVAWLNKNLNTVVIPSVTIPTNFNNTNLFDLNTTIYTVKPTSNEQSFTAGTSLAIASQAAARNRFMKMHLDNALWEQCKMNPKSLWKHAGLLAYNFMQQAYCFDLDLITEYQNLNKQWRNEYYENTPDLENQKVAAMWSLAQFSQMGTVAIEQLFISLSDNYLSKWDEIYQTPVTNLPLVFDLNGSYSQTGPSYAAAIGAYLGTLHPRFQACHPIFKSLKLILPDAMHTIVDELIRIVHALDVQKNANIKALGVIDLYNFDINKPNECNRFFDLVQQRINNGLITMVRLPEWDRNEYTNPSHRALKTRYRALQNLILENQRQAKLPVLNAETKKLDLIKTNRLQTELKLNDYSELREQKFDGENVLYPLPTTSLSLNIQQQLQEAVQNEFQQELEQEQEAEQEDEHEISRYAYSTLNLIDRNNIDTSKRCRTAWEACPQNQKQFSGWGNQSLSQLFSLWVGSTVNAEHVIKYMELRAVEKIMEFAPSFRLNVARDNLPVGFYLAKADDGFVLCYDKKREMDDVHERTLNPKPNPFTVALYKPMKPSVFHGDYRQFAVIAEDTYSQKLLWRYLAVEEQDAIQIQQTKAVLIANGQINTDEENVTVQSQEFTITGRFTDQPGSWDSVLPVIRAYALRTVPEAKTVIDLLFQEHSVCVMDASNLKAFGQLFYDHEAQMVPDLFANASKQFLILAQQIHSNFGEKHFTTWKQAIIDSSENLSELLTDNEITAVGLSIATLKDNVTLQNVWWALLSSHARATGHVRYQPLWASFQKVLNYTEKHNLIINESSMIEYLNTAENFNAQVFLYRLHAMLKNSESVVESRLAQTQLLNNIPIIDWSHSGAFYTKYEKFPYWDQDLMLTDFYAHTPGMAPSYIPKLDRYNYGPRQQLPINHTTALRFISQRLKVPYSKFIQYKTFINAQIPHASTGVDQHELNSTFLRLYLGCIAMGIDNSDTLTNQEACDNSNELYLANRPLLNELAALFEFNGEFEKGSISLRFSHIIPLIEALQMSGFSNTFISLRRSEKIIFVNACGRALQCYFSDYMYKKHFSNNRVVNVLASLIKLHLQVPINTVEKDIFLHCPWMIFEQMAQNNTPRPFPSHSVNYVVAEEISNLRKQLNSIDFDKSTYLPTVEEYTDFLTTIRYLSVIDGVRKRFVNKLIQKGCAISNQDAAFRPLNEDEKRCASEYMDKYLKVPFKDHNIRLLTKLLPCLAVLAQSNNSMHSIENLLETLAPLDNKPFHNDLGQVLGLLVEKANAHGTKRYYSVELLSTWIEAVTHEEQMHSTHYPTELLAVVLDKELASEASANLLHSDLNKLSQNISNQTHINSMHVLVRARLPNQYKPVLALAMLVNSDAQFILRYVLDPLQNLHSAGHNMRWVRAVTYLVEKIVQNPASALYSKKYSILACLFTNIDESEPLYSIWQDSQIKFATMLIKYGLEFTNRELDLFISNTHIQHVIIMQALGASNPKPIFATELTVLNDLIKQLSDENCTALARYFATPPTPSIKVLISLLKNPQYSDDMQLMIHDFESKIMPENKRNYSLGASDKEDLSRIFSGFKQKGKGLISDAEQKQVLNLLFYSNSYSEAANLANLRLWDLLGEINTQKTKLMANKAPYASARLLACMREMLVRKTGMWVNHTQIIDLIYASLHDGESTTHQVRPGEGKSIISIMRVAYLAINGYVVDLYSAKESLSRRDHDDFGYFLDALGIPNAYITPDSPAHTYQTGRSLQQYGAVNFGTIGNLSLFESKTVWDAKGKLNNPKNKRVAFIDEADFVLKLEKTQFNFSAADEKDTVYNYDAWVYAVTHHFYHTNKDNFVKDANGTLYISINKELKGLCEALQANSINRPKQSEFLAKYIVHAAGNTPLPEAIERRNSKLKSLLTAAHIAAGLKEGVHYCIRTEFQQLGKGTVLLTRAGKVLIANQVKEGSTYSDYVQQCLHVRLNEEAIALGHAPNFFIEPDTQIALSSNAKWRLKTLYSIIEGCSGTMGDADDIKEYDQTFKITNVIKLPTHEAKRSVVLATIFAEGNQNYITAIVDQLLAHTNKPILVTCEDDIAVKEINALVRAELEKRGNNDIVNNSIIVDTNDSGKLEKEIVPLAGAPGKITISSRMGRGTDIKPETELGLLVIRTYPAISEIEKQELGRQGRNNSFGTSINIYDYANIRHEYETLQNNVEYSARLNSLYFQEKAHLSLKLEKHNRKRSDKYEWLANSDAVQEKYLQARTIERLKYTIRREKEMFQRKKEYLIAALSGDIVEVLNAHMGDDDFEIDHLKRSWLNCKSSIETLWNTRLAGKEKEDHTVYNQFIDEATKLWHGLCITFEGLNPNLLETAPEIPNRAIPNLEDLTSDDAVIKVINQHILSVKTHIELTTPLYHLEKDTLTTLDKTLRQNLAIKYHPDKVDGKQDIFLLVQILRDLIATRLEKDVIAEQPIHAETAAANTSAQGNKTISIDFVAVLNFYQNWVDKMTTAYARIGINPNNARAPIFGTDGDLNGLDELFSAFYNASTDSIDNQFDAEFKDAVFYSPLASSNEDNLHRDIVLYNSLSINKIRPRIEFFTKLSGLPTSRYLIPMHYFAKSVAILNRKYGHTNFTNYLDCMHHFLSLDLFENCYVDSIDSNELAKFGILCELITKVASTQYVANNREDTKILITNITKLIHKYHCHTLDQEFADTIATFFASDPRITAILSAKDLETDLDSIFDILLQNKNNVGDLKVYNEARMTALKSYLQLNHQGIRANISLIRPILNMQLADLNKLREANYLPSPNTPKNLTTEQQTQFWNFLVQRQPITKDAIDAFLDVIHHGINTPTFHTQVFQPLMDLPPYIPLTYISKQLMRKVSMNNNADAAIAIVKLHAAGKAMIKFALDKDIIKQDIGLEHADNDLLSNLMSLFKAMTPEDNREFFETCNDKAYVAIPAAAALSIANIKLEENLSIAATKLMIHENFNLMLKIRALPTFMAKPLEAFYIENMLETKGSIDPCFPNFINALAKISYDANDVSMLLQIFDMYRNDAENIDIYALLSKLNDCLHFPLINLERRNYLRNNVTALSDYKEFIELSKNLNLEEDAWNHLLSLFLEDTAGIKHFIDCNRIANLSYDRWAVFYSIYCSNPQSYKEFMEITRNESMSANKRLQLMQLYLAHPDKCREFIDLTRNAGLTSDTFNYLLTRYLNEQIRTTNELRGIIESIGKAADLAVNNNWAHYFGDDKAKRDDHGRLGIMKLIVGKVLEFGQGFVTRCFSEYQRLISSEIQIPDFTGLKLAQRQAAIIRSYRKVVHYSHELKTIANQEDMSSYESKTAANAQANRRYFSQQEDNYEGMWFKNTRRVFQAHTLFTNLKRLHSQPTDTNYYLSGLQTIVDTQKQILDQDKGTRSNTKGYSRLYDISTQMFLHLTKQCMLDPQSSDALAQVEELMELQFKQNLQLLQSDLPDDHRYKALFNKYDFDLMTKGSVERQAFFNDLHSIDYKAVPKNLRLLLTNLEGFAQDLEAPFVCAAP